MLSSSSSFFQTKRSLSEIKAELLPAYFKVWAEAIDSEELILVDLNAGNGVETNGEKATALQILEAFQNAENATENGVKTLKLFLGDASKTNLEKLKQGLEIPEEEGTRLPENIAFLTGSENQETLSNSLGKVPGLLVAEPFSYPLAQEVISGVMKGSAADLFLLFDYKKLEKAFVAETPDNFIRQLFGEELPVIKAKFQLQKSAKVREQFLMEKLEAGFRQNEFYPLIFKINAPGKATGSACLILAGKNAATYFRAKEWLRAYSEFQEDGVPLFGVNLNYQPAAIPGFSDFLNRYSLENLTLELAKRKSDYHYQTVREIYESHSPGTHYILANYLAAFQKLSTAGTVNLVDANNKKQLKATPGSVVFYRLHSK